MNRQLIYTRRGAVGVVVVAVALIPLIAWGAYRANLSNSNDVRDWLPSDYPETQQYRSFTEHFGTQDFIMASWPGCTLDDERLDAFVNQLANHGGDGPNGAAIGRVVSGRSLLEQMTSPPMELSRKVAIARLRGVLIGPDDRQTCAVIIITDGAARRLEPTLELIRQTAESSGVAREEVRLGGIPVLNAALNRESTNSLIRQAGLSGLLGLVIAWVCFRDLRLTTLVLAIGVFSASASLAVIPLTGVPLNAVLITMVPLVYVTAVSGAIHLSNYYLGALEHSSPLEAPGLAVAHAVVPLLLAAITTMLGLFSLYYSDLNPIRVFGIFSAIGVAIGFAAQFLLLPAALMVWLPKEGSLRHRAQADPGPTSHLGVWPTLGKFVVKNWFAVLAICLTIVVVGAFGLPKVQTSIQLMRLFSPHTPVLAMTRWLEEKLGATIPLEIVLRFRPESQTAIVDRARLVAAVDLRLRKLPGASGCLSAATFSPPAVTSSASSGVVTRAFWNSKLKARSQQLSEAGWIAHDGDDELWRISLRVRGIEDMDYAALVKTIADSINPILDAQLKKGRSTVEVVVTGTAPIVFKARQSLLDGMLFGLGTDLVLIVVGVIAITRNLLTGVVMLLLSIFPTTLIFGSMGYLGVVVDIGSVMTPCIALGVTVDDVIHFVLCHRQQVRSGQSPAQATLVAYDTCGRAIVQSWGIIGIGLAAFALSTFVPTFRFGLLMLLLLTAGMLGNLFFLPSLLTSPLGRWMTPRKDPIAIDPAAHEHEQVALGEKNLRTPKLKPRRRTNPGNPKR
jgi:predicted RND superfamily exporter protein